MKNSTQVCAFRLRWHYNRLTEPENIRNVALVQLAAGTFCLLVAVYLYFYTRHESHVMLVMCLALLCTTAGIFGCLYNDQRVCIRFAYLSSSVGVLIASVLFFFTTYCLDFFAAVSHSQQYLTEQTVAAADEFHFWLKCAVVMSIIVATLFTLAGLCVVLSFTPKREQLNRSIEKDESSLSTLPIL